MYLSLFVRSYFETDWYFLLLLYKDWDNRRLDSLESNNLDDRWIPWLVHKLPIPKSKRFLDLETNFVSYALEHHAKGNSFPWNGTIKRILISRSRIPDNTHITHIFQCVISIVDLLSLFKSIYLTSPGIHFWPDKKDKSYVLLYVSASSWVWSSPEALYPQISPTFFPTYQLSWGLVPVGFHKL